MKCQILSSGKNKKNAINLSSAELAWRVIKINIRTIRTLPNIALDKALFFNQKVSLFFLFLVENI